MSKIILGHCLNHVTGEIERMTAENNPTVYIVGSSFKMDYNKSAKWNQCGDDLALEACSCCGDEYHPDGLTNGVCGMCWQEIEMIGDE